MGEDKRLQRKCREALRLGKIPDRSPDRLWGGHGNGSDTCQICGNLLMKEDIAFDLEYEAASDPSRPVCYSVHLRCFNAWDLERQKAQRAHSDPGCVGADKGHTVRDPGDARDILPRGQGPFSDTP